LFLFDQSAVQDHGVARVDGKHGRAALAVHMRFACTGVGSCAWGVMPSPLHAVRMKRCGHLVPFRTKSLPRPTSKARQQQRPQPSRTPPTQGVYVACVPASVRHACSFPCRLLQRGLHDAVCLLVSSLLVLVFVLPACSCLSRTLPRGQGYGTCPLTDAKPNAEIREQWGSSQQGSPAPLSWPRGLGGCLRHSPLTALSVVSFFLSPFVGDRLSASLSLSLSFVAPCPLKLGLWTGLFVCSFARGALAGCMWCSTR